MRKYKNFDINYLPNSFGLNNFGNTCYFNSFIQAIISCTSFNQEIKNFVDDKILKNIFILSKKNINVDKSKIAYSILNEISDYENKGKNINKLNKHNPNDSDEILGIFFNYLSEKKLKNIISLFKHRQRRFIYCHNFNENYESEVIENNVFYLSQDDFDKTKLSFVDYIMKSKEYIVDNKCSMCNNKHPSNNTMITTLVPEIIIIRVNRYKKKNYIYNKIPENFKIPVHDKTKFHVYGAVSYIERRGNHYYAICKRNNNKWYLLDDNSTKMINKFNPSPFTYLIFYHLIKLVSLSLDMDLKNFI